VAIERDQAEHVILESQERFRAVLDSSPLAVHLRDLDGRHIFVNRAMAELFGVPREAWTGRRPKELLPDDVAALLEQDDPEVLASDHPVDRRQSTRLPDGREVTLLVTHFLLRRPDGTPYALCGILTDITDQVEAQREFERLWLHAPDPLCVAGFDGHFKQVNPAWSRLLGWTEEELLARPYAELVHQEDRAGLAEVERRILAGESVRGYEGRFRCRDESFRWLSLNAIPMQENQTLYVITRDITEEKRLAEQFQQAQKMEAVGQLASGVAHDFNNLLTVINCYSQLLLDEISADSPQWADVAQVLEAGQRASELTSQLLAFSRKAIIEPKILDVNVVVESSARLLRRLIGEDVRLDTSLGRLPPVKVDPGQLEQVFMNLAVNARDAMPEGGSLSISTKPVDLVEGISAGSEMVPPGTYVQITVKDDGSGMTPDVQARIFEPFFTTKGPGKGTGLGLATAYGIVRQAGGTILVESEPGMGATFRILLPADAQAADAPATGGPSIAPRGTETVLIAEDEGGVRRIARTILEMQGYAVLCAESGREVMRIVAEYPDPIHLLLTDVVMPDFGGRVIADEVRRRRPGIGILYMSGYTDDAILRHGVESSRDAFIQKPFTPLTLARRVREVLDSSGAVLDRGE
jgi:two-component system, cell cycle sensor histidine kinase and response regulator CckA